MSASPFLNGLAAWPEKFSTWERFSGSKFKSIFWEVTGDKGLSEELESHCPLDRGLPEQQPKREGDHFRADPQLAVFDFFKGLSQLVIGVPGRITKSCMYGLDITERSWKWKDRNFLSL